MNRIFPSCIWCVGLILVLACIAAHAQTAKPTPEEENEVVRVDTELVDVPLNVQDKTGRPILNLKRANFTVFEDGQKQEIAEFFTTSAPFEIAILLDTSGSTRSELETIKRAAQHFIDSLRPGDRVAIVSFRTDVADGRSMAVPEVVSRLTEDRDVLRSALARVSNSNGTPLYDSLIKVAETVFRDKPADEFRGRRALVALTDGVDSTSSGGFAEANDMLTEIGITSYFIRVDTRPFFEENLMGDCQTAIRFSVAQLRRYYSSFGANSKVERTTDFCKIGEFERLAVSKRLYEIADDEMKNLSRTSGGRIFEAADVSEARAAFKAVADEIGTKYSLGYYPTNEKRDGTFRKIRVEIKGLPAGAVVRSREGYTARRP
ncbi:MAG: VWA domain-containing protein [Pyrinomonadaceae bacterium]|nr:VWA domain-containing protein [Pyrinomonadaceae bacterium]